MIPLAFDLISTLLAASIFPVATTDRVKLMRSTFDSFSGSILWGVRRRAFSEKYPPPPKMSRNRVTQIQRFELLRFAIELIRHYAGRARKVPVNEWNNGRGRAFRGTAGGNLPRARRPRRALFRSPPCYGNRPGFFLWRLWRPPPVPGCKRRSQNGIGSRCRVPGGSAWSGSWFSQKTFRRSS